MHPVDPKTPTAITLCSSVADVRYGLHTIMLANGIHYADNEWQTASEMSSEYPPQCGHRRQDRSRSGGEATSVIEVPPSLYWKTRSAGCQLRAWRTIERISAANTHCLVSCREPELSRRKKLYGRPGPISRVWGEALDPNPEWKQMSQAIEPT